MRKTQEARRLRTRLELKDCALRRSEIDAMEEGLGPLEAAVAAFPFADLHVTLAYSPCSDEYHVKTSLKHPGGTLFTGEHDSVLLPAYDRCLRKLVQKVERHKQRTRPETNLSRDTVALPSYERLQQANDEQDYAAFRQEISGFDEVVRRRVRRWIQRYPELDATFGDDLPMEDLVEEVLLTAFERYASRPGPMRLGDWLESLIDPAMRSFLHHPEEELESISYARTLQEMRDRSMERNQTGDPDHGDDPDSPKMRHPR